MQSNTCLVKFNFVCPHCKGVNSKVKTLTFAGDLAAKTATHSIRLICTYCGVLATRVELDDLGPASVGSEQFESEIAELRGNEQAH